MQNSLRKQSLAIIAVGSTLCLLLFSVLPANSYDRDVDPLGREHVTSGLPMQLRIPAIKVKATIEYVGLTRGGAMDVPKKDLNVAWFSLGPRPGEIGSAVIAGHYSWRNHGEGGIFRNLDKLRKGDMLYIRDDKGKSLSFIVRDNRLYDFDEGAGEIFSPNDGNYLNLITCAGTWNSYQRSSTKRRVVFAELVQQIVDIAGPS